jgi:polar amino acid transport system substrate-binding protein
VYVIMTTYFYIALSLVMPQETVSLWQETLQAMKDDGTFEQIYQKHVPGADISDLL